MFIIKVDIKTGEVLEDNLEVLWAQHNSNSGLKEAIMYSNPALQVKKRPFYKHLFERIKEFNSKRYQRWSNQELYQLVETIWIKQQGYNHAAAKLGRSKAACRQMMHHMRKAGILSRPGIQLPKGR